MFLVALAVIILVTVPLAGGNLSKLAETRLRWVPVLFVALVIQVVIVNLMPGGNPALHRYLHLGTYLMIAGFLVANRHIPGLRVIAAGALANAIAIFSNNGVMPASAAALRASGEKPTPKGFINSGFVAHPRLSFLGDMFAMPRWMPLHNVFSIGDVCIVVGAAITVHTLCGSRLVRRTCRPLSLALATKRREGDHNDGMGSAAGTRRRLGG